MNRIIPLLYGFLLLFLFAGNVFSRQVNGGIITHNEDTINGMVKITKVNLMNRGLTINGVDLETFHYMVSFKEEGQTRFKTYLVNDIKGFHFSYKNVTYKFQQFELKSKTFVTNDQVRNRFLCQIFKGEIALFKDIIRREVGANSQHPKSNYQSSVYYEYYLYSEEQGLTKVLKTSSFYNLSDLLKKYGVEQEYLQHISPQAKFKDIKEVLINYEKWKAAQAPVIYTS